MNQNTLRRAGFNLSKISFTRPCYIINLDNKFMCNNKHFNIQNIEQNRDTVALFDNIHKFEDFNTSKVVELSRNAKFIGIKKGMLGSEVIQIYSDRKKLEQAHVITGI